MKKNESRNTPSHVQEVGDEQNAINNSEVEHRNHDLPPVTSLSRFFCVDFIASGIIFLLILFILLSIILTTPLGSLIKKGGVLLVVGLCLVDFAIFKIMLFPVINKMVKEK